MDSMAAFDEQWSEELHAALQLYRSLVVSGEEVDLESFVSGYPEFGDELRQLLPVAELMVQFNKSDPASDQAQLFGRTLESGTLGDFRILGELGRGGMGVVYEAEQISLARRVAVKVLPLPGLMKGKQLERFRNEARAAATLKHPNIVNVFAIGCEGAVHYYAMELICGVDLSQVIGNIHQSTGSSSQSTETDPAARLFTQRSGTGQQFFRSVAMLGKDTAEALHFAHLHGVVHRDVKPANLLLAADGTVHVTDFGLAHVHAIDGLTVTGDLVGTLRYMSPEQIDRDHVVDQRTDVYSLGLVLYELIAGQPAFNQIAHGALCKEIVEQDPAPLRAFDRRIPMDLETILTKAISKDPGDRYRSALAFAQDLQQFIDDRPIKARRSNSLQSLFRFAKRNRQLATSLVLTMLCLVGLAAASTWYAWQLVLTSEKQARELYARNIEFVDGNLNDGRRVDAMQLLDDVAETSYADSFEYELLRNMVGEVLPLWMLRHDHAPISLGFSSDGASLVSADWMGALAVWDVGTGQAKAKEELGTKSPIICCQVDGQIAVGGFEGQIQCFQPDLSAQEGKLQIAGAWMEQNIVDLVSDPTGDYVVVASGYSDGTAESRAVVTVFDAQSSAPVRRMEGFTGEPRPRFSDDSKWLAIGGESGNLQIWDAATWSLCNEIKLDGSICDLAFVSDGKELAVLRVSAAFGEVRQATVDVFATDSFEELRQFPCSTIDAAFSPDDYVLEYCNEADLLAVVCHEATLFWKGGLCIARRRLHQKETYECCFSSDGSLFATSGADNLVKIWKTKDLLSHHRSVGATPSPEGHVTSSIVLSGNAFAFANSMGKVRIVDSETNQVRHEISADAPDCNICQLAFSVETSLLAISRGRYDRDAPGTLVVYDIREFSIVHEMEIPDGVFRPLAFINGGRHLLIGGMGHITQLDATTFDVVDRYEPDVPGAAIANKYQITWLWSDSDTGDVYVALDGGVIEQLSVSDEGIQVQGVDDDIWKADPEWLWYLSGSPDGKLLVTVGAKGRIRIWNSHTRRLLKEMQTANSTPLAAAFSVDGKRIVTTGTDGYVRFWDWEVEREVLSLPISPAWIWHCEFSADGRYLVFGSEAFYALDRVGKSPSESGNR